jgi:tripartite-type tricarboxylate transporter receptor subunit TctC
MSSERNAELPDIPTVLEKANNDNDRDVINLIVSRQKVARPFAGPPAIPLARLKALRQAFSETMKDEAFLGEAKALSLEISPLNGDDVESLIKNLYASKPESIQRARDVIASGGKQ